MPVAAAMPSGSTHAARTPLRETSKSRRRPASFSLREKRTARTVSVRWTVVMATSLRTDVRGAHSSEVGGATSRRCSSQRRRLLRRRHLPRIAHRPSRRGNALGQGGDPSSEDQDPHKPGVNRSRGSPRVGRASACWGMKDVLLKAWADLRGCDGGPLELPLERLPGVPEGETIAVWATTPRPTLPWCSRSTARRRGSPRTPAPRSSTPRSARPGGRPRHSPRRSPGEIPGLLSRAS